MGVRDHVRGALIALVLLAHGVYALPLPPAMSRARVKEPTFQRDVDVWVGLAAGAGLRPTRAEVEDFLVDTTGGLHHAHEVLKTPFAPVMDLVGANQSWGLFASTTTNPDRLEVAVGRRGEPGWTVLLRRLDPCCTWREPALEYRRIRGVWDGQRESPRAGYKGLAKWISAQAFAEFPDVDRVRVRLLRSTLTLPGDPPGPGEEIKHERVIRREAP